MRYGSIDILRTVAIFVMVFVHFGENLSGYTLPIAGLGAPLFAFLSGVSYVLWVNGQHARGASELKITKVSVRRGLFVFVTGFVFNVFVWLPEDTFNWDVLTFIGAALLLLNLLRKLPLSISVLVAVLALGISPILRGLAHYPSYWVNGYYDADLTLSDVLIGFFTTGYFPLFPWIAYSIAGLVTATLMFPPADSALDATPGVGLSPAGPATLPATPSWRSVLMVGLGMIATSAVLLAVRPFVPTPVGKHLLGGWTMFPPTIEYVLATMGMALSLFGVGHRWIDDNPRILRHTGLLSIAKTFSRYSLTIYVLHHVVHLWPLWIYGLAMGQEPTHYWKIAMPMSMSMPLAALFLGCCYAWFRWVGSDERRGIESMMRWVCD
ncbi:heparan-alpha-glucosaminide N-acetyltransferase domain-containing protein [Humisphaera borealis]|uniref:DUF1624 domain-containing protein n=1 Tax=Humisphaera borealis TaxID=2807512 RepID=A0A7M2WVF2_9BACT|nr:heparan-alpha-glucosaminide N-acetyltransferase domain-containing protein [Humisphaera borealis]QOV89403.1 DUF1624 domain-containing protein [Humisphaera borealis]